MDTDRGWVENDATIIALAPCAFVNENRRQPGWIAALCTTVTTTVVELGATQRV